MLTPLVQPQSRYDPSPLIDLADAATRHQLTDSALKAFFNIMSAWKIRDVDARPLLGDISNGAYYALKKGNARPLSADRLQRISYLVGIFKALNILHDAPLADAWMQMPNTNRIFGGLTPLAYLQRGGLPAFETLRRLLDARRGGQ